MKSKIICGIVLGVMTIVACQAKPTPQITKAVSQLSAVWHDEVVTFTDPLFGLSIDLPPDWHIIPRLVTETNKSTSIDMFYSSCDNKGRPFVAPPCTKIEISGIASPIRNFEELRALIEKNDYVVPTRVLEQREMDISGLPAIWTTIESMNSDTSTMTPMVQVFIMNGKQGLRVNAYGELGPVANIVASIHPTQQ